MELRSEDHHQEHDNHERRGDIESEETTFCSSSDLCQQLLDRYSKSAAPQHRHLCAAASAMRSILCSESLPLIPPAYFAAAISAVSETSPDDSTSAAALLSFLSLVLPLVPPRSVPPPKAGDAVSVIVKLLQTHKDGEVASGATSRAAVKCLGVLVGFCDPEDWDSLRLGFETLFSHSVDRRPKVRKCAQVFVEKFFKSFQSSSVSKEASKLVLSLVKDYMPLALTLKASRTVDGSKPEHLEVLHMLNVLKLIVPHMSVKVSLKIFSQLSELMSFQFSALTSHVFIVIDTYFETLRVEDIVDDSEKIIRSLASYTTFEGNPIDTVISAAKLLKSAIGKIHVVELNIWIRNFPLVLHSIAGLLTSEASVASQASSILKELINDNVDQKTVWTDESQLSEEAEGNLELGAIKSICGVFEDALTACDEIPNEHILTAISVLFMKLGESSFLFMKTILQKLAYSRALLVVKPSSLVHLDECIGSAISAMGPEKVLMVIPISFHVEDNTCSNIWLVPILKKYTIGASLGHFIDHIVPLAKSIRQASRKVRKSAIGDDLRSHSHDLLGLVPAYCRYPTDIQQNYAPLAKFFNTKLKKDAFMLETIAISLQELIKQNRSILKPNLLADESDIHPQKVSIVDSTKAHLYSKKSAKRNIKALESGSIELLQSLTDLLLDSPPEKHSYLKVAIGCLASITDPSITKNIFISALKRFQLTHAVNELQKLSNTPVADKEESSSSTENVAKRCVIMELAYCLVEGASEDLIDLIYSFVKNTLQALDESGHFEAYYTLSRILEEHPCFCSSQQVDLEDLLLGLKSPADTALLKRRFSCLQFLFVHALKTTLEGENTKAFLILNEIILAIKDAKDDMREAAYNTLLTISSSLRKSSPSSSDAPLNKLISMIMGYLSGSSPQIKSGAVSALSLLVYKDRDICQSAPDTVPSVLDLLQSRTVEVIKAALGFVKVLVTCLEANDLQKILSNIVNGVLPWSSVSRNHFRSKVTVILEIMIRKCGSAAVELATPEKYMKFIKTVMENRHGKPVYKDVNTADAGVKSTDSSSKWHTKQKRLREFQTSSGDHHSRFPKKRKTGAQHESHTPSRGARAFKPHGHSNNAKPMKGIMPRGNGRRNNGRMRSLGDKFIGEKRKTDQNKVPNVMQLAASPGSTSFKSRKARKMGGKQKMNK